MPIPFVLIPLFFSGALFAVARAVDDSGGARSYVLHARTTLEPAEVASLVEKFREENPLLNRLTDAGTVDVEAEHSTGDIAPGVTPVMMASDPSHPTHRIK